MRPRAAPTASGAFAAIAIVALVLGACSRQKSDAAPSAAPASATGQATQPIRLPSRTEIPTYAVVALRADESIAIDGKLDEPAWRATQPSEDFVHPGTGAALGQNASLGGIVRLRYDSKALYFAFEARDKNVRGGFDRDAIDPQLWTRDTVELMLDPDGDGDNRDYYELQINPQGLVFDSQFDAYNSPRVLPNGPYGHQDFDAKLQRAVTVLGTLDNPTDIDQGYIVEGALLWQQLTKAKQVPPPDGAEWRANFYVMKDNGGVSWSPILGQGNFHKAPRFGRLRFVAQAPR